MSNPKMRSGAGKRGPWLVGIGAALALVVACAWPLWGWLRAQESRAAVARGRAALQAGQFGRALRAVAEIRPGDPAEGEALTVKGLALAALQEVGPARLALERAWQLRPDPMAAKVLAAIYLGSFETDRALAMLQAAATLDPTDFRPWYAMGESVYLRLNRPQDAAAAFREALKRKPDHEPSQVGLAAALLESNRPDEAGVWLDALLRDHPDDPALLALAARRARDLGHAAESARLIDRVLARDPNHRAALLLRAEARQRAGDVRAALADAEHAETLDPNDPAVLGLLAQIETALGLKQRAAATVARRRQIEQRKAAMEQLVQTIQAHPTDPAPRCRLAQLAAEAGLTALALQSYQAALALDPHYRPARDGLAALPPTPPPLGSGVPPTSSVAPPRPPQ
jgi:tetratricopeptide (TPR) repeat protein